MVCLEILKRKINKIDFPFGSMKGIEISTVIGCQNRCEYCPQDLIIKKYKKRSKERVMKFEVFKKIIDKIYKNIDFVSFSGFAEPFLNKNCSEMILYAHKKGLRIFVFTTCVGMSHKDIEEIKGIPFDLFWIHVPGKKSKMNIKINKQYLNILRKLFESKVKNLRYICLGKEVNEDVFKLIKEFDVSLKEMEMHDRAGNLNMGIRRIVKGKNKKCMHWKKPVVLPNGDVFLCCQDYGLKHYLGNLLKIGYENLFESKEFKKIERSIYEEDIDCLCRRCYFGKK